MTDLEEWEPDGTEEEIEFGDDDGEHDAVVEDDDVPD